MSGSGGYLGVNIADLDQAQASELGMERPYGVFINSVVTRGPADDAGLEDGDVIVRWNGERLESMAQLQRLARETPAGREVRLTVLRDGAEREVSLELGSRRSLTPRILAGGRALDLADGGAGSHLDFAADR
ncbi:S1C family serine protease [Candidatus Palauibacter sp.]|uniref:S1C family serine protease n=1 Tax=Candidatus Palauibacter sp. TaxID=3101350 RepID=UPI003B010F82